MFRLWREFQEYRAAKAAVKTMFKDDMSQAKDLQETARTPGFQFLREKMIARTLAEVASGDKRKWAAGLSLAVGILAECYEAVAQVEKDRNPDEDEQEDD